MISNAISVAPAGVHGAGLFDVPPYACLVAPGTAVPWAVAVRPMTAGGVPAVQGTGLPTAGTTQRLRGRDLAVAGFHAAPLCTAPKHDFQITPLGIHPPGRPTS